jgi:endoglucanase
MTNPPAPDQSQSPKLAAAQIKLLERLCNACAVSGDEGEVRKIVLEHVRPHADEVEVDTLGNVLVTRYGQADNHLRVMLSAHMDEVGFMMTHDDGDGIFRFKRVGGISPHTVAGKTVWIGPKHVPGVIGVNPLHLTPSEEHERFVPIDSLRIDIGPGKNQIVKIGDRATFATTFKRIGPSLRAKALDDRIGITTLIELIKHAPPNVDILGAFTVQEEVGGRGAQVASYKFQPDLAIALECSMAFDFPAWDESENTYYNTRLGEGPAIYVADRRTLSDPRLIRHLADTAEVAEIPYQIRQPGGGGTDAGAIHKQLTGIPSISVAVPGRYIHTPASIVRLSDWKHTIALLHAALTRLTPAIFDQDR